MERESECGGRAEEQRSRGEQQPKLPAEGGGGGLERARQEAARRRGRPSHAIFRCNCGIPVRDASALAMLWVVVAAKALLWMAVVVVGWKAGAGSARPTGTTSSVWTGTGTWQRCRELRGKERKYSRYHCTVCVDLVGCRWYKSSSAGGRSGWKVGGGSVCERGGRAGLVRCCSLATLA